MTECGRDWGFEDDCEAVSHPMTREEYKYWYNPRNPCAMIAFILDDIIMPLEASFIELLTPDEYANLVVI